MSTKILEWQLELPRLTAEQDLDDDRRIQRHGHVGGRHGGEARCRPHWSTRENTAAQLRVSLRLGLMRVSVER